MRILNVFAALSGFLALTMLAVSTHVGTDIPEIAADFARAAERLRIAAFVQLGGAVAGLAIANRTGRLNMVAGTLILAGAAIFSGAIYVLALFEIRLPMLAPVGGITLLIGWLVLAFAKPRE